MARMNGAFSGDDDRLNVQHCTSPTGIYEDPNSLSAVPMHQFAKGMTNVPGEDPAGITMLSLKRTHFYDEVECTRKEQETPVLEVENEQYENGGATRVLNSDHQCRSQSSASASAKDSRIKVILRWLLICSILIGSVIVLVIIAARSLNSSQTKSSRNNQG